MSKDDVRESVPSREIFKFTSLNNLCFSLSYIISVPELCDVTFVVGPEQVPVHGVRAIMGTRSRVFYQLIVKHQRVAKDAASPKPKASKSPKLGTKVRPRAIVRPVNGLSDKIIIPVRKYGPEVFRRLVSFVHCGTVDIDVETVVGLLCGADQFVLNDLKSACWEFVRRCMNSGLEDELLHTAGKYRQHNSAQKVYTKIYDRLIQLDDSLRSSSSCESGLETMV